jgi:hypothetical protein
MNQGFARQCSFETRHRVRVLVRQLDSGGEQDALHASGSLVLTKVYEPPEYQEGSRADFRPG